MLVVFDLDGTVVDSLQDLAVASSQLVAEYGGRALAEAEVARMIGDGARQLVSRVLATAGFAEPPAGALERYLAIYEQRMMDHTRVYPGMIAVLDALTRSHALALLTNKPGASASRVVDALGLGKYFPPGLRVCGDGPITRKPAPDGLIHLSRTTGIGLDGTLLVGDSGVDLETARAAGVAICLATYGFGFANLAPGALRGDEHLISQPADLLDVVGELAEQGRAARA